MICSQGSHWFLANSATLEGMCIADPNKCCKVYLSEVGKCQTCNDDYEQTIMSDGSISCIYYSWGFWPYFGIGCCILVFIATGCKCWLRKARVSTLGPMQVSFLENKSSLGQQQDYWGWRWRRESGRQDSRPRWEFRAGRPVLWD